MRMLVALCAALVVSGSGAEAKQDLLLHRTYAAGTVLQYQMTGSNDGWRYTIEATDCVKQDARGRFFEEIAWTKLGSNASPTLTPASEAFRQTLSLDDPATYMKVPDLSKVQPLLIGPITDLLTFYSDLLLATNAKLMRPGQHAYVQRRTPNSWADGRHIVLGEDVVDFDIRVAEVRRKEHSVVRHVPPPREQLQLPASWMRAAVADRPNNFVQVSPEGTGFVAGVGQETFDVRLTVDMRDGKILIATLHNPVLLTSRTCADRELTKCGPAMRKTTLREVTLRLLP